MLALARLLVEIGAAQQITDVEADRREEPFGEFLERTVAEERIELNFGGRRFLEERIAVVPGTQRIDREPEAPSWIVTPLVFVGATFTNLMGQ